jgi:hypothetical protein
MARIPRKELIDQTEVGVYHCVQRAVRRAWLCGQYPLTGQNFDHRKVWIQERLEFLAGQFSIDVCSVPQTPETSEFTSAYERIQAMTPPTAAALDAAGRPPETDHSDPGPLAPKSRLPPTPGTAREANG